MCQRLRETQNCCRQVDMHTWFTKFRKGNPKHFSNRFSICGAFETMLNALWCGMRSYAFHCTRTWFITSILLNSIWTKTLETCFRTSLRRHVRKRACDANLQKHDFVTMNTKLRRTKLDNNNHVWLMFCAIIKRHCFGFVLGDISSILVYIGSGNRQYWWGSRMPTPPDLDGTKQQRGSEMESKEHIMGPWQGLKIMISSLTLAC